MNAAKLRLLFADETLLHRMTSSAPPVTSNLHEHTKRDGSTYYLVDLEGEPPDRNGENLSAQMIALIGGIRADFVSYGPRHPIRRAIAEYSRLCARRHRLPSWKDHATPICAAMLRDVVEGGASVQWCADRYGLSYPRAERLILTGLNYVGERYAAWEQELLRHQGMMQAGIEVA